jgi:hypothetical protein
MIGLRRGDAARKAGGPQMSLAELKATIEDEIAFMPGWDEEDSQAALVMLAGFCIGDRDPDAVSRFTGVPVAVVEEIYGRLLENGVWGLDGSLHGEWTHPEFGKHAFQCDVFVATGKLRRANRRQIVVMPLCEATQ